MGIAMASFLITGALLTECGPGNRPLPDERLGRRLKKTVKASGAVVHLRALQKIADDNGGHRASPGPGYEASVDYVIGVLRGAGYDVTTPTYQVSEGNGSGQVVRNVIAQTGTGDPGRVVLLGAHLDSVPEGPGIVDNGSGVAALLEIATRLGPRARLKNTVRFAFFGSEESGSKGAKSYVRGLTRGQREAIMLYLNVDMVASANGGYFVQGGKGRKRAKSGPPGSAEVARVLADELAKTGVRPRFIKFVGDDERPFIKAGIPSGGAENGDRDKKTRQQATDWGGRPGEPFDPCYHKPCDRLDNVDRAVLARYLAAVAGTAAYFAMSEQDIAR